MTTLPVLCVAVTGHRPNQIAASQWTRIRREVTAILEAIENVSGKSRRVLNSSLAEGADRVVTAIAVKRGWSVHVVLPFGLARYARDFSTKPSKAALARQVKAADKVTMIDGERLEQKIDSDAPYAEAGRVLISNADITICIWNGAPPKGPGGTAEVAALSLARGGLVIWIPAIKGGAHLIAPARPPRAGSRKRKLFDALSARFGQVQQPPEMRCA